MESCELHLGHATLVELLYCETDSVVERHSSLVISAHIELKMLRVHLSQPKDKLTPNAVSLALLANSNPHKVTASTIPCLKIGCVAYDSACVAFSSNDDPVDG